MITKTTKRSTRKKKQADKRAPDNPIIVRTPSPIPISIPVRGFLHSLTQGHRGATQAIADLIDNSVDAGADKVTIEVDKGTAKSPGDPWAKDAEIHIWDNGKGLDAEEITNALTPYNSPDNRSNLPRHGLFGVGLKQSCLSFGAIFQIIARNKDGDYFQGTFDSDYMKAQGQLCLPGEPGPASAEECKLFRRYANGAKSGCLIRVTKLHNVPRCGNPKEFKNKLKEKNSLKRIFRNIIDPKKKGLKIYIGTAASVKPLEYQDLLEWSAERTIQGTLGWKVIPVTLDNGAPTTIQMRVAKAGVRSAGNNGFSVLRNEREIFFGHQPDIYKFTGMKAKAYGIYCELKISSSLDEALRVNPTKDAVQFPQSMLDKLSQPVGQAVEHIISQWEKEKAHRDLAESGLINDAHLANETLGAIEEEGFLPPRFEPLGPTGTIFTTETCSETKKLEMVFNRDHAFVKRALVSLDLTRQQKQLLYGAFIALDRSMVELQDAPDDFRKDDSPRGYTKRLMNQLRRKMQNKTALYAEDLPFDD